MQNFKDKPIFRTVMLFVILFCVATVLIMLGRRNDAVTMAQLRHSGVLMSDEVSVSPINVGGKVIYKGVKEGDVVEAGFLLMELDKDDYLYNLEHIKAQIDNQVSQINAYRKSIEIAKSRFKLNCESTRLSLERELALLESTKTSLQRAKADYDRYASLLKKRAISQAEYDNAYDVYVSAKSSYTQTLKNFSSLSLGLDDNELKKLKDTGSAQGLMTQSLKDEQAEVLNMTNTLHSMEATLENLKVSLKEAQLALERTSIYAPSKGKVLNVLFEEGELVSPSSMAVVLDNLKYYFDVFIPETSVNKFKKNAQIKVYVPALDKEILGVVRYINPAPSYADLRMTREQGQSDLTTFEMRIDVDDPDLIAGLTMEIEDEF